MVICGVYLWRVCVTPVELWVPQSPQKRHPLTKQQINNLSLDGLPRSSRFDPTIIFISTFPNFGVKIQIFFTFSDKSVVLGEVIPQATKLILYYQKLSGSTTDSLEYLPYLLRIGQALLSCAVLYVYKSYLAKLTDNLCSFGMAGIL